jgi:cytoskeletal protein RodZ
MNQTLYTEIAYTYIHNINQQNAKLKKKRVTCTSTSSVLTHSSTYKTAHTDACKAHSALTVNTTEFLKMNPRVRKKQKTQKTKNETNLEKLHFAGLYCIIMLNWKV